jgi:TatD DNase family protein
MSATPIVDIGANLTHASFKDDLPDVVARAREHGVATLIVTGTSVEESRVAAQIAERLDLCSTAGMHPHHAKDFDSHTIHSLKEIARSPRVVAIGECGLDFNRNYSPHPAQEDCFLAQLHLGVALSMPLFLHSRDAHPRFAEILASVKPEKAVAHCFTGEREELRAYLDLGLYIGITGWICDERRGAHLVELVREVPRDRLLLETDSPYLTPRDLRPQPRARRNEPAFLPHILRAVAKALGREPEAVAAETTRNARKLFGLK